MYNGCRHHESCQLERKTKISTTAAKTKDPRVSKFRGAVIFTLASVQFKPAKVEVLFPACETHSVVLTRYKSVCDRREQGRFVVVIVVSPLKKSIILVQAHNAN